MSPHRANIINLVQLIASAEEQIQYQARAPVNVANELVNQWFCDSYHPGFDVFDREFSARELQLLAEFNDFYDQRADKLPSTLHELHAAPAWLEVVARAQTLLHECDWTNVEASYRAE